MSRSIVLVGPMGAGKSTIGRLVASAMDLPFSDIDRVIEERTGADIPWIFDVEGEDGFRQREHNVLEELLQSDDSLVIATGGGVVLREDNRALLKSCPHVFYLSTTPEQLFERTGKDKKRPLLQVDDPKQRILDLLSERDPLYQEVSTHVVSTEKRTPRHSAQEIIDTVSAD